MTRETQQFFKITSFCLATSAVVLPLKTSGFDSYPRLPTFLDANFILVHMFYAAHLHNVALKNACCTLSFNDKYLPCLQTRLFTFLNARQNLT